MWARVFANVHVFVARCIDNVILASILYRYIKNHPRNAQVIFYQVIELISTMYVG